MSGNRLPKIVFFGELNTGSHPCGGSKKWLWDYLKHVLVSCNIDLTQLENLTMDQISWLSLCVARVAHFEERQEAFEWGWCHCHLQLANSATDMFPCHLCPRTFRLWIGLLSYLAAHRRWTEMEGHRRRQQCLREKRGPRKRSQFFFSTKPCLICGGKKI